MAKGGTGVGLDVGGKVGVLVGVNVGVVVGVGVSVGAARKEPLHANTLRMLNINTEALKKFFTLSCPNLRNDDLIIPLQLS